MSCYLRNGEIAAQWFVVRIFPHSQCQLGYGEISSCPLLPQKWGNIRTMFRCADISPFAVPAGIRGNFLMSFATSEMGKYPHNVSLCGYFPIRSASWDMGKFPHVLCYLRNGEISAQCLFVRIFLHAQCQPSDGEISSATTHLNTGEISAHSILLPKHCGHEIFLPALVSIPRYFCITIS